jgi:hypothetical protein
MFMALDQLHNALHSFPPQEHKLSRLKEAEPESLPCCYKDDLFDASIP